MEFVQNLKKMPVVVKVNNSVLEIYSKNNVIRLEFTEIMGLLDVYIKQTKGDVKELIHLIEVCAKKTGYSSLCVVDNDNASDYFLQNNTLMIHYQQYRVMKQIFTKRPITSRYLVEFNKGHWERLIKTINDLNLSLFVLQRKEITTDYNFDEKKKVIHFYIKGQQGEIKFEFDSNFYLKWNNKKYKANNFSVIQESLGRIHEDVSKKMRIKNELKPPKEYFKRFVTKIGIPEIYKKALYEKLLSYYSEELLEEKMAFILKERKYKKIYDNKKWQIIVHSLEDMNMYLLQNRMLNRYIIIKQNVKKEIEKEALKNAKILIKKELKNLDAN